MMRKLQETQKAKYLLLLILVFSLVFACSVRLIAEYDEAIDQGITALQRKMEDHLSKLEKKMARIELLKEGVQEKERLKKEVSYEASEEFYREFYVDLRVLKTRADSYVGNELTTKQMDALEEIAKAQEDIHKRGFQTADDVADMRTAFTRGFKGILKLEIAKKRGKQ
jgi:predicted aldo/keto reductase-like oxidoreductase